MEARRSRIRHPSMRPPHSSLLSDSLPSKTPWRPSYDRFIPERSSMDFDVAHYLLTQSWKQETNASLKASSSNVGYQSLLVQCLLKGRMHILSFKSALRDPPEQAFKEFLTDDLLTHKIPQKRHIPNSPDLSLDLPELVDDFYSNLLDWSSNGVLAIALGNNLYVGKFLDGSAYKLMSAEAAADPIASVSWSPDGQFIAIGLNSSDVQLWDLSFNRLVRTFHGMHQSRIGCLDWNKGILTTGGMDGMIANHDTRLRNHIVQTYRGHQREICGLKWSGSGQQLASGGNDDIIHIWDVSMSSSNRQWLHRFDEHTAAVKALAWCPFQSNLLASGGGSSDGCIKFWDTQMGSRLDSVHIGSQVCALLWNKNKHELLSAQGFPHCGFTLWKYPSMRKIAEPYGHSSRVLCMAASPDGCTVASAGADEALRFWNIFGSPKAPKPTVDKTNPKPFARFGVIR